MIIPFIFIQIISRVILFFIPIVLIIGSTVWVYYDAKKFQQKGVNLKPGLISALVLIFSYLLFSVGRSFSFFLFFIKYRWVKSFRNLPEYLFDIIFHLPIVIFILLPLFIYLVLRSTRYKKLAKLATELGNPPLPPSSPRQKWIRWLFIIVAPVIVFALAILILVMSWTYSFSII